LFGAVGTIVDAPVDWLTLSIAQVILVALVLTRVAQLAAAHRDSVAQLEHLADHDPLTGLANRRAVDRHLESLSARVGASKVPGVVLLSIDLNGFKTTNDNHGHAAGDELLCTVATRLAALVRQHGRDLVGRLGGDEYVVIVEGDPAQVGETLMVQAREVFASPFALTSGTILMSASIGLASASSGKQTSVDELLTQSDHAMYEVKRAVPHVKPGDR